MSIYIFQSRRVDTGKGTTPQKHKKTQPAAKSAAAGKSGDKGAAGKSGDKGAAGKSGDKGAAGKSGDKDAAAAAAADKSGAGPSQEKKMRLKTWKFTLEEENLLAVWFESHPVLFSMKEDHYHERADERAELLAEKAKQYTTKDGLVCTGE